MHMLHICICYTYAYVTHMYELHICICYTYAYVTHMLHICMSYTYAYVTHTIYYAAKNRERPFLDATCSVRKKEAKKEKKEKEAYLCPS